MKYTTALFIATIILIASAPITNAQTSVINNVSVSASTGGNSASDGTVVEGKSKTKVFIETIVNGEVIEFIDEENTGAPGEDAVNEYSSSFISEDGAVQTESNIYIQTSEPTGGEDGTGALEKQVENKKESITENIAEDKQTFLAVFFQKFRIYVLSIFS